MSDVVKEVNGDVFIDSHSCFHFSGKFESSATVTNLQIGDESKMRFFVNRHDYFEALCRKVSESDDGEDFVAVGTITYGTTSIIKKVWRWMKDGRGKSKIALQWLWKWGRAGQNIGK